MLLSPGKMRGLQTSSNRKNVFTILAVDHGASLAGTIQPKAPESVSYEQLTRVKGGILKHLASTASAVLIDPVYGLAPAVLSGHLPGDVGLLLAVEDGDYASVSKEARLFKGWSVAKAKKAGANAIKCFFYYHPDDTKMAAHQETFVRQLVTDCQTQDIPLFAEPLSYDATPETRQYVVLETARRISRLGIDILKIEFPVDIQAEPDEQIWREACEALSENCETPWALLSAGVNFDQFKRQVTIASQAGASGYLAGRAIWQEGVTLNGDAQLRFWQDIAKPRLQELADIASEEGRPWTHFYKPSANIPPKGWHQQI